MDIKLIVATHKQYRMPSDPMYVPIHVGAAGKEKIGYTTDDTNDNISLKNKNYCELTGLYWAWKNLNCDYCGLVHYRRYFVMKKNKDKWSCIASKSDIESVLKDVDIITPKKRNYYIETTYNQYAHAHNAIDLDTTRSILQERYPNYVQAFDDCMKSTKGHKFNMFIMKKDKFDAYCSWLFDILFELENRLDISKYSAYDARVFGFVSERLLDVWMDTNHYSYKELPVLFMEDQNWFIKGTNFLKRKFFKKKG